MKEVFESFAKARAAGIMMVFVVLILLFNSVFQPLTILASLPLSVGGVVGAAVDRAARRASFSSSRWSRSGVTVRDAA